MEAKDEDVLTQEISKDKTYWTCVHIGKLFNE